MSSTTTKSCIGPSTVSGISTKSIWMYSNGLVAYTIYHSGLGTTCPVLVFMQARHFRHLPRINFACAVFVMPCMRKCSLNSAVVSLRERWRWSPWWHSAITCVVTSASCGRRTFSSGSTHNSTPSISCWQLDDMPTSSCARCICAMLGHRVPSIWGSKSLPVTFRSRLLVLSVACASSGRTMIICGCTMSGSRLRALSVSPSALAIVVLDVAGVE